MLLSINGCSKFHAFCKIINRDVLAAASFYHDEAGGDWIVAAVAQLSEFGPVVVLAEEPSIFFIIPARERCAALTTSGRGKEIYNHLSCELAHPNLDLPSETAMSE